MGYCQEVENSIGRSTGSNSDSYSIFECLTSKDLSRSNIPFDELND